MINAITKFMKDENGATAIEYGLAVSESLSTLINYPFLSSPMTISGVAMMRVQ